MTGQVFEIAGGKLNVADGWRDRTGLDKGARFEPAEVGAPCRELAREGDPAAEGLRQLIA